MEEFRLSFQNEKENVSLIRLSASFIAMKCGFSVDDIESLTLIFKLDGSNPRENNEKDKISEMIIQSLMDEYEINGSEIKVIKNRK